MTRVRALWVGVIILAAAAIVVALIVDSGSALTKQEYLRRGNRICQDANEELDAAFGAILAESDAIEDVTPEQADQIIGTTTPIMLQALDDVEALEGPKKLDEEVDALLARYRAVIDDVTANPATVFEDGVDLFAKLDRKARKLGLDVCAES